MDTLEAIAFLKPLDPAMAKRLAPRCRWQRFGENELVIDYDDRSTDVYFILSGRVRVLYRGITGKEVIIAECGAGEFFGELAAIDNIGRSANVTALEATRLCVMPGPVFLDVATATPDIGSALLRTLAGRIRALNGKLTEHSFLKSRERLYAELLRLSRPRGKDGEARVITPPPLQHDLANRIGCRREAVSREIASLEREGLVDKTRGALVLTRPAELNRRISAAMRE